MRLPLAPALLLAFHLVVATVGMAVGGLLAMAPVTVAAQTVAEPVQLTDLSLASGLKLPLPAGQWQVLAVYGSQHGAISWRDTALRNQDPAAAVPLLLVREAATQQRWAQPACQIDSDNTFLIDWHDSRQNTRQSKCSRLRIVGANLAAFRSQAEETPGWSRALTLLPVGSVPESEDVLLAETSVLDLAGGGVRIEALVRADVLGGSSGSLLVRDQSGTVDTNMGSMRQWLSQVNTMVGNVLMVSPAARPVALENLLGTSVAQRGDGTAGQTSTDTTLPLAVGERSWVPPARTPADELVYVSKGSGSMGALELLVKPDTDLVTPSEGDLIYAGPANGWPSVLLIQHAPRLYSVVTSARAIELAPGIKSGTRLSAEQLLARGSGRSTATTPRHQLNWHLVAHADTFGPALATDSAQLADALRALLASPQVDTQLALGRGVLQLDLGPDVTADTLSFRIGGVPFPATDLANAAVLLPAAQHLVEMTSGRVFKSTVQRQVDIKPAGTWLQFADYRGRDLGLFNAQFYANDLGNTRLARAVLDSTRQATTVAATASPAIPVPAPEPVRVPPAAPALVADAPLPATPPPTTELALATPVPVPVPVPVAAPVTPALSTPNPIATAPTLNTPSSNNQMQQEMERLRSQLAQLQAAPASIEPAATTMRPLPPNPRRKALVIGNNAYEHVARLDNAQTDALAIADALKTVGFQVTVGRDLSERRMKELLRNFRQTVQGGDEVVVYFAGHGVQLANTNYLLPVDIRGQNEEEVKDESIPLQRVLDDMQERRAGFMLAIIDACRDNPFRIATRAVRSAGLAPTSAATGQMIIFSAGTGQQALDKLGNADREPNGLFTRLLLREMKKPGLPIDRIVRSVRTEVARLARTVGHEQTPAVYDQTLGDFYFIPLATNGR